MKNIYEEMDWTCPDCGTSNDTDRKRCRSCGFNIEEEWPTESESSRGIDPYDY